MKQSQSKDTIGKIILATLIFVLGEGIFNWGGYIVLLLLLPGEQAVTYWYAMALGLLVSTLSGTTLGLASIVLIMAVFVYGRVAAAWRTNPLVLWFFAIGTNFFLDWFSKGHWSYGEILASGALVFVLAASGYLKEEASIRV